MSRLDTWKKRFRISGDSKPKVQVQTTCRLETMTVTQEWRFKQLQRSRAVDHRDSGSAGRRKAWYTLPEAAQRLATSADRLLRSAAAGDLACYVATDGLRGYWHTGETANGVEGDRRAARADVSHLRLPPDACGAVEVYGSTNVSLLKHPTARGRGASFVLQEPVWIAPERILLKHPLPALRKD